MRVAAFFRLWSRLPRLKGSETAQLRDIYRSLICDCGEANTSLGGLVEMLYCNAVSNRAGLRIFRSRRMSA